MKTEYTAELPGLMYRYFSDFTGSVGAPSFSKFARSIGVTLEELSSYRKHEAFERAYRECGEIRRDYLIDMALSKRFDASFTKFLLGDDDDDEREDDGIKLTLEVVEP